MSLLRNNFDEDVWRFSIISGFRRGVNEIFALFGRYTMLIVVSYRRFRTTYPSHLQGSNTPRRIFGPSRWDRLLSRNVGKQITNLHCVTSEKRERLD